MNSPLILLVFWFVINILIKSAKDKKRIEEARRKRAQHIESKPLQSKSTQTLQRETLSRGQNKNKSIIDVFKDEIEKEIQREKQKKPVNTVQNKPMKQEQNNNNKIINEDVIEKETNWRDDYFSANTDIDFDKSSVEIKTSYRKSSINIKKDLLNGIIFSEILSEPKSMKSGTRSM